MPAVTAEKLTGVERFNQPVREMPNRAFAGTEGLYDPIDYFCTNEGISLNCKCRPRPLRDPITLCFGPILTGSRPLRGSPPHVDHPDLPTLTPIIRSNDPIHRLLRGKPLLQQVK